MILLTHIFKCATDGASSRSGREPLGESEVDDFDVILGVEEYIFRFQISVDNASVVQEI